MHHFHHNRLGEPAPGVEIALVTNDVPAAFKHACAHGATQVLESETKPWGQVVCYVRDLNGVLVEICSEVSSS
jgi:lactoylglutathione lyase